MKEERHLRNLKARPSVLSAVSGLRKTYTFDDPCLSLRDSLIQNLSLSTKNDRYRQCLVRDCGVAYSAADATPLFDAGQFRAQQRFSKVGKVLGYNMHARTPPHSTLEQIESLSQKQYILYQRSLIFALEHESRILRHCWDVYQCLLVWTDCPFSFTTITPIWALNRRRGNAHKPDRKTVLTFNTSRQCLRILLSCFRARTSAWDWQSWHFCAHHVGYLFRYCVSARSSGMLEKYVYGTFQYIYCWGRYCCISLSIEKWDNLMDYIYTPLEWQTGSEHNFPISPKHRFPVEALRF